MRFCWRLGQLNNAYLEVVLKCVKASECPQHGVTAVVTPVPLPPFFLLLFLPSGTFRRPRWKGSWPSLLRYQESPDRSVLHFSCCHSVFNAYQSRILLWELPGTPKALEKRGESQICSVVPLVLNLINWSVVPPLLPKHPHFFPL